jgi:hypothetical protein
VAAGKSHQALFLSTTNVDVVPCLHLCLSEKIPGKPLMSVLLQHFGEHPMNVNNNSLQIGGPHRNSEDLQFYLVKLRVCGPTVDGCQR